MLEAASAVLGAATTAVAPGTTLSEAAPGTTLSEAALDRTFLARALPYALDALYQMPLMHRIEAAAVKANTHRQALTSQ
jgi:hypothetical protein